MGLTVCVGHLADLIAQGEDEMADQLRADFAVINDLLAQSGLPTHDEPEFLATDGPHEWDMWGYSGLHCLRRVAAHLDLRGALPPPLGKDDSATDDPVLEAYFCATVGAEPESAEVARIVEETAALDQTFDHLIVHSDAEGYYLPIPLDHPIIFGPEDEDEDEDDDDAEVEELFAGGNMLGSSLMLRDELLRLRDALGIPPDVTADDERLDAAAEASGSGPGWERYGVEAFTCVRLLAVCEASIALGSAVVFA